MRFIRICFVGEKLAGLSVYLSIAVILTFALALFTHGTQNDTLVSFNGKGVGTYYFANTVTSNNVNSITVSKTGKSVHKSFWVTLNNWLEGLTGYGTSLIGYLLKHINS